jgi:hypothetical protein
MGHVGLRHCLAGLLLAVVMLPGSAAHGPHRRAPRDRIEWSRVADEILADCAAIEAGALLVCRPPSREPWEHLGWLLPAWRPAGPTAVRLALRGLHDLLAACGGIWWSASGREDGQEEHRGPIGRAGPRWTTMRVERGETWTVVRMRFCGDPRIARP